jgi:hypothetical protein
MAVALFELDNAEDIPKNHHLGVDGAKDGTGERTGGPWTAAEGWDKPGPLPGQYSHMGHWQNQTYEYVPDPAAFVCETWANAEDWTMRCDKPDVVAGPPWNGKYLMKDNWVPGNPWVPDGDDCFGVHSSECQTSVIADCVRGHKSRVTELPVPATAFLYMEAWAANGYFLAGETLSPMWWGGFHDMSHATPYTFQSDDLKHYGTQRLGSRMVILGDGHAQVMSWREMRCFADSSKPTTGWVVDFSEEDSTQMAAAEGVPDGDWASCVKAPGEQ